MNRRFAWIAIAAGLIIEAIALLSPLTPYPIAQLLLEPQYLAVQRGYDEFLARGTWQAGDTGFDIARRQYMEDVAAGTRPVLDPKDMLGTRLDMFRLDDADTDAPRPEAQKVFVIFSNQLGHIVDGVEIKRLLLPFRSDYTAGFTAALVLAGTALIYGGLRRLFDATGPKSAV